jgi:hypothetical protein
MSEDDNATFGADVAWENKTENEKYAEWSDYYNNWQGRTYGPLKTYVEYCNLWDNTYGVVNGN